MNLLAVFFFWNFTAARREAFTHVAVETGPAPGLHSPATAQPENGVEQLERIAQGSNIGIRSKVAWYSVFFLPGQINPRKFVSDSDFDVRIAFIIAQIDIIPGLIAFYKVVFQNESFHFTVGDDKVKITYPGHHRLYLGMHSLRGLKIGAHSLAKNPGFSYIEHLPLPVFEQVYSRLERHLF